jgi:hypothetical protein
MPTSLGRYCRRCRYRISRRVRLCPVCGAVNPKGVDYLALAVALFAAGVFALWWWG